MHPDSLHMITNKPEDTLEGVFFLDFYIKGSSSHELVKVGRLELATNYSQNDIISHIKNLKKNYNYNNIKVEIVRMYELVEG